MALSSSYVFSEGLIVPTIDCAGTLDAGVEKFILASNHNPDIEPSDPKFGFFSWRDRTVELVPAVENQSLLTRSFQNCKAVVLTFSIHSLRSFEVVTTKFYRDITISRGNNLPLLIFVGTTDSSAPQGDRQVSQSQATAFANSIKTRYFEVDVNDPASAKSPLESLVSLMRASDFVPPVAPEEKGGAVGWIKKLFRPTPTERRRSSSH